MACPDRRHPLVAVISGLAYCPPRGTAFDVRPSAPGERSSAAIRPAHPHRGTAQVVRSPDRRHTLPSPTAPAFSAWRRCRSPGAAARHCADRRSCPTTALRHSRDRQRQRLGRRLGEQLIVAGSKRGTETQASTRTRRGRKPSAAKCFKVSWQRITALPRPSSRPARVLLLGWET